MNTPAAKNQNNYVLRTVEERGVRFIQLWFTDILGTPKSFSITPAELEDALEEGMTFDGSSIDGFSRVQESDVSALPDPKTFQILPFQKGNSELARIFCDIYNLDGTPFEGCPRHVLKRTLTKAHDLNYNFFASPELEYFYFANQDPTKPPKPLDNGSYFELTVADLSSDLRKRTVLALEEIGIPVEYAQHEDAPSQHEIDLRYTDALTMADTIMTVRLVIKEVAHENGVFASFMPKPLEGVQGSGMHTHFSLFQDDKNIFHDQNADKYLSETARYFIAGLLYHAHEITAITNQWVNSYKRLVSGYEAPIHISWAHNNRSALVRVPVIKETHPESTRIEYRAPDPACNPYLCFAVILAAGLDGIKNNIELPQETTYNLFELNGKELLKAGIRPLPLTLEAALAEMEKSELVAATLGDHVFEWFLRNKYDEWNQYSRHVTNYELTRYLPTL